MTLSVAGSNSTAVGKQKRNCGSRLFTRRRAFAISAELHQELALGGQLLDAMVLPVRDIDVAILVEGDAPWFVELTVAAARAAALADELSVRGEHLQAVVAAIDNDDVAVLLDSQ